MASRCSPKGISAMLINFRISALVPVGLIVESVAQLDDSILVTARAGIKWRVVLCVDRLPDAFTAGMFVRFRTCRAQAGAYSFGSRYAGFVATPSIVGDGS